MKISIIVTPKKAVLDPQGKVIKETLENIADDEVIVIEKDGTERIKKKMEFDTLIVE